MAAYICNGTKWIHHYMEELLIFKTYGLLLFILSRIQKVNYLKGRQQNTCLAIKVVSNMHKII